MKKHLWAICFTAALIAFTTFIALDTFVLSAAYDKNATGMNTSMFSVRTETQNENAQASGETVQEQTAAVSNESAYKDENVSITLTEYERYGTTIYVADVELSSAAYLKTAFANDTYGRNVTAKTSVTAEANGAILAINGDYYGAQETGYVIRNGIVYRSCAKGAEVLCIYADGTMKVVSDRDYTAGELVESGVWQAFSFGPGLVENGVVSVDENDEVGRAKASNPRTAIGLIDANHFVFVVSDGRTDESEGLSLYELAAFMQRVNYTFKCNTLGK